MTRKRAQIDDITARPSLSSDASRGAQPPRYFICRRQRFHIVRPRLLCDASLSRFRRSRAFNTMRSRETPDRPMTRALRRLSPAYATPRPLGFDDEELHTAIRYAAPATKARFRHANAIINELAWKARLRFHLSDAWYESLACVKTISQITSIILGIVSRHRRLAEFAVVAPRRNAWLFPAEVRWLVMMTIAVKIFSEYLFTIGCQYQLSRAFCASHERWGESVARAAWGRKEPNKQLAFSSQRAGLYFYWRFDVDFEDGHQASRRALGETGHEHWLPDDVAFTTPATGNGPAVTAHGC